MSRTTSPAMPSQSQPDQHGKADTNKRRHKAPEGECKSCDWERAQNSNFHPSHDPSPFCESGGHTHCSCDICF